MKKFLFAIVSVVVFLASVSVFATQPVSVVLDGEEIVFPDAQPFVASRNRAYVPIRFVAEELGAQVSWEDDAKTAVIVWYGNTVRYTVGYPCADINNEQMFFDSYGFVKESRVFVPLSLVAEMMYCEVGWNQETRTVVITSPGEPVAFPEPELSLHYPESKYDKRMFWITLDNFGDFQRECQFYEFKIEFLNPEQFNTYEREFDNELGWQKFSRTKYVKLSNVTNTIVSVDRELYTTREGKKTFKPKSGDTILYKLTVHRKPSNEIREYVFSSILTLP